MSFEKDYEKGLRDRKWGRALQSFAKGNNEVHTGKLMTSALCGTLRSMASPKNRESDSVRSIVDAATRAAKCISSHATIFPDEANNSQAITQFRAECAPVLRTEENSDRIEMMAALADEKLADLMSARDGTTLSPETFRHELIVSELRSIAETSMLPAIKIAGPKRNLTPYAVEAEFQAALSHVPFKQIANDFLAGKGERLRAPSVAKPTVQEFASLSLIGEKRG